MTRFDPEKKIADEKFVLKALSEEGWIGYPVQLRALAYHGEELRQRYENECSYAWAGNSEHYRGGSPDNTGYVFVHVSEESPSVVNRGILNRDWFYLERKER